MLSAPVSFGYSVLTHEAIVDSLWDTSIQKMLLKRFPAATPEELEQAHAYVYGGCIIQDMGYYPFSSHLFSDLTHYVRTGDFIVALIRESQDINEYAFALGALAHYAADNNGHRIATNLSVPILYPKLRRKFGKEVTYWDNPLAHIRTEFGFDVLQVAQGRYAPDRYRAFVGFEVSKPVLERAFLDTYGIELKDVFGSLDLALGTFRYSVGSIIPGMTRVAWQLKKDQLAKEIPGHHEKEVSLQSLPLQLRKGMGDGVSSAWLSHARRDLDRADHAKDRSLQVRRVPRTHSGSREDVHGQLQRDRGQLSRVARERERRPAGTARTKISISANLSAAGKYLGADQAYDQLLEKLADRKFAGISPELRGNLLDYYKDRKAPPAPPTKKAAAEWAKLQAQLAGYRLRRQRQRLKLPNLLASRLLLQGSL